MTGRQLARIARNNEWAAGARPAWRTWRRRAPAGSAAALHMTTAETQQAGIAALQAIAARQARQPTWRDRRRFRVEARALTQVCVCTCTRLRHEHLRPGSDCSRCGKAACRDFRRARPRIRWGVLTPWRKPTVLLEQTMERS